MNIEKYHKVATEIDIECSFCKKLQPLGSSCVKCGKKLDQIYIPRELVCYYQNSIEE